MVLGEFVGDLSDWRCVVFPLGDDGEIIASDGEPEMFRRSTRKRFLLGKGVGIVLD